MAKENRSATSIEEPKKKRSLRYPICIALVVILTALSFLGSLFSAGNGSIITGGKTIWQAVLDCKPLWLLSMIGMVIIGYCIEGLIMTAFCRLYTRHYHWHQGLANSAIGAFYSDVTPGATGGQPMQAYTLKKQGIEISNAASIMVMWFIIYQVALISYDVVAIVVERDVILSIRSFTLPNFHIGSWNGELPMIPLIIAGFAVNVFVILLLFVMSYSHKIHNFVMHYVVGFLGKIRVVKNPDKTRESLRVQVENFKIELKRLQSNVPFTILIYLLFLLLLGVRFSIPYFAGLALDAYGPNAGFNISMMFDASCRSAFHQMVSGLVPLPGGAGISELVYNSMFGDFYVETVHVIAQTGMTIQRSQSANVMAAQIIWRVVTFHMVLIVSSLVALLYHGKPKEDFQYANRDAFVTIQMQTFDGRKASSDSLYETRQMSKKAIMAKNGDPDALEEEEEPKPAPSPEVRISKGNRKAKP